MSAQSLQQRNNLGGPRLGRSLSMARRKLANLSEQDLPHFSRETLDEMLSSALLAWDNELGKLLRKMDEISESLNPDTPDVRKASSAIQLAAWCVVRQTMVEKELRSLALTDDLTGLYNRRGFLAAAAHQLKLARRNSAGLLLFFADVDNLKQINDSYGHGEGDRALIRIADSLEHTFRDSDIKARLGGDEFAVLAPEASSPSEEIILSRLQESVRHSNQNEFAYELSLSVGVARLDRTRSCSLGELMAQADRAMYERKRSRARSSRRA
jgi:diguanylate cyclase (GGDEF)-like protein